MLHKIYTIYLIIATFMSCFMELTRLFVVGKKEIESREDAIQGPNNDGRRST